MVNRKSNVLFVSVPSAGMMNPMLAIAGEVNRRDEVDVWFATTDERRADIENIPGERKVNFASLGSYKKDLSPEFWDDETYRAATSGSRLRNLGTFLDKGNDFDYMDELYQRMLEEIDRIEPVLAVVDSFTSWAIDALITRKIPFVLSVSVPISNFYADRLPWGYPTPTSGLPQDMTFSQKVSNVLFRLGTLGVLLGPKRMRKNSAGFQKRKAAGLANPAILPAIYSKEALAVFGYSVFGFEHHFPKAPSHVKMLGSMVPSDPGTASDEEGIVAWLDEHESVIYAGFGTIMRPTRGQVEAMVEVTRRLGPAHHVLWKLPKEQQKLLPASSELPENLRVVDWLPSQIEVLAHPHVRVFFNHGAANAVHEGLHFDKPLMVLPFWMDCHDGAMRVVDSGAGLMVASSDAPDAGEMHAKLIRLLTEDGFRDRAALWGRRLREAGGATAAADFLLEQRDTLVGEGTPSATGETP